MENVNLHDTIYATVWVEEWMKTIKRNPQIPYDEGTMIGWFANAIMAGYDKGLNKFLNPFKPGDLL